LQPSGIILIAAVLFFYARLIWLQRAKITQAREAAVQENGSDKPARGKTRKEKSYFDTHRFRIINRYLLIGAIVLMVAGAFISTTSMFGDLGRSLWWLPTAGGIVLLSFSFA
jgi:hypothetical protein